MWIKVVSSRPIKRNTVMTNDRLKEFTYGALTTAGYGLNPLFALPLYRTGMKMDSVLFYHYSFAIVMLDILMRVKKQSLALKETDVLPLAVMGLLFSFSSLFLFESYNYMDAGVASTISFAYPVTVTVIMAIFFHEKVLFITMFSITLAFTGISLLYEGGDGETLNLLDTLFVILSSLTYAIYIVGVNRSSLESLPTAKLTFYILLFGIIIYAVCLGFCTTLQPVPAPLLWMNVFPLALFPTVISLITMTLSIHRTGSTPVAILGALEPVTALFCRVVVFGEQLMPCIILGVLMILTAVTLIVTAKPLLELIKKHIPTRHE